jgi:hypothetical protein
VRRQGRDTGQLDRLRNCRREGQGQIFHGLGDQRSCLNVAEIVACGRARWKIENESFKRTEKPRIRTRVQFRPWPDVSRDDAGGPQSARLRLAHRTRTARAALARRSRSGGQADPLPRPHSHAERLFPSWQTFLKSLATFSIPPDLIEVRDSPGTPSQILLLELLVLFTIHT